MQHAYMQQHIRVGFQATMVPGNGEDAGNAGYSNCKHGNYGAGGGKGVGGIETRPVNHCLDLGTCPDQILRKILRKLAWNSGGIQFILNSRAWDWVGNSIHIKFQGLGLGWEINPY